MLHRSLVNGLRNGHPVAAKGHGAVVDVDVRNHFRGHVDVVEGNAEVFECLLDDGDFLSKSSRFHRDADATGMNHDAVALLTKMLHRLTCTREGME